MKKEKTAALAVTVDLLLPRPTSETLLRGLWKVNGGEFKIYFFDEENCSVGGVLKKYKIIDSSSMMFSGADAIFSYNIVDAKSREMTLDW